MMGIKGEGKIILTGSGLWVCSALLQWLARNAPGFGQWYAANIYPVLVGSVGRLFGALPFSTSELLLYLLLLYCLYYGVAHLGKWKCLLSRTFFLTSVLFFIYTANCGINYYRRPFSDYLEYRPGKYSAEELKELCQYLTRKVNESAAALTVNGEDIKELASSKVRAESRAAMAGLGRKYPCLSGYYPPPKRLAFSRILSIQRLAGIYSPFTVEANYNGEMTAYNIPHTACHELSHLKGFMREDEANFIGFLACVESDAPEFRYSGYLTGWIYAGNALADEDPQAYAGLWEELAGAAREDLRANSLFWDRFDTKVADASEALNDTYLRINSQPEGIKTYGRAVDLMLEWYKRAEKTG